jgi:hypothetical protein
MYLFHTDPGHGWLQVKRQELADLGILDKISHYSYQKGDDVYLEEDCDYSRFIMRMKELGRQVEVKDLKPAVYDSPVRSYASFSSNVQKDNSHETH